MQLHFGYGTGEQIVNVPEKNLMKILRAKPVEHTHTGVAAVEYALAHPIGAPLLREKVQKGQKVCIVTSDISRPFPTFDVMPSLLAELGKAGIPDADITLVFALGSHRHHTPEEMEHLAGKEAYGRIRCVDSDPEDCVHLGTTKAGTPVDITRAVAEADFRICLGNIEFHYFAGYSGGYKAIMPGVSTPAAIQNNHKLMLCERSCAGRLKDNPLRQDIEEAGAICGVDYILNAVLDEHKHIVYAVAGDPVLAHHNGCRYLNEMYRVEIPEKADIVLVSQGGAPKDANLYQTQKALDNAKHAVKKGGTVILMGACNEWLGSKKFEQWLTEAKKPEDLIERVHTHFELGGHKAAAIAMVLQNARIDLISEMDDDFVRRIFLNPQPDAQTAFDRAMERYGENATVIAMPFGGATLPVLPKK